MLSLILTAGEVPGRTDWPVYVNVLHHYRVCYPASLLAPQGETDNSAGQAFRGRDGAELDLYGYYSVDETSLGQELDASATSTAGPDGNVSFRKVRPHWGVASGTDRRGRIFYIKMFKQQGRIVKLEMRYPASAARRYGQVVEHMMKCFVLMR